MNNTIENFKHPEKLTGNLIVLIYAIIFMDVISTAVNLIRLNKLMNGEVGGSIFDGYFETGMLVEMIFGFFMTVVVIIFVVTLFRWIYWANKNARSLGAENMRFTPKWAVGWFFIPIFFFWKPYLAMREIWNASADPVGWEGKEGAPLLKWWWFFNVIVLASAFFVIPYSWNANELHELQIDHMITTAENILDIPMSILLLFIVKTIGRLQVDLYNRQQAV